MKKKLSVLFALVLIFCVSCSFYNSRTEGVNFLNAANKAWAIYFCPSDNKIRQGFKNSSIVFANEKGQNMKFKEKAFSLSSFEYYDNKLFYQNEFGVKEFSENHKQESLRKEGLNLGYNASGILEDLNVFYFLVNGSFKQSSYESQVIIGDSKSQVLSEIDGFVYNHANDGKNLYLIVDDPKEKTAWRFQKYEVQDKKAVLTKKHRIVFDKDTSVVGNIIMADKYIYVYASENNGSGGKIGEIDSYYMFKFSKDTFELVDKKFLFDYSAGEYGFYHNLGLENAVFMKDKKIYISTWGGKVFTYDTSSDVLEEKFVLQDYKFVEYRIIRAYFNRSTDDISFLYNTDKEQNKYTIAVYDLDGKLKEKVNFEKDKSIVGSPTSFIRIK